MTKTKSITQPPPAAKAAAPVKVSHAEWYNLYTCLKQLPDTQIQVNVGTIKDPQFRWRSWESDQIGIFRKNRLLLEDHVQELEEKQNHLKKVQKEIADRTAKANAAGDEEKLKSIFSEAEDFAEKKRAFDEWLSEKIELPPLKKIPASHLKGFQFLGNGFMGLFWDYLVDTDK